MDLTSAAIDYAERGWYIFPVEARGKRPLISNGVKGATSDRIQIVDWWDDGWEDANIGLATGKSGLVVIDIDDTSQIRHLQHRHLPRTLVSKTGSGGYHLFYLAPEWPLGPTVGRLPGLGEVPGIDLRAGESYVILPPSMHPSGRRYEWDTKAPIAACPSWLKPEPPKVRTPREIKSEDTYAAAALRDVADQIRRAPVGQRNHTLNAAVFPLRRFIDSGALDAELVREVVSQAAEEAGLSPREITPTLRSALGI